MLRYYIRYLYCQNGWRQGISYKFWKAMHSGKCTGSGSGSGSGLLSLQKIHTQ